MFNTRALDIPEKSKKRLHYSSSFVTEEFRCFNCNKLLARKNKEGIIAGEIKCARCGVMNEM
jgi:hypothetical protein